MLRLFSAGTALLLAAFAVSPLPASAQARPECRGAPPFAEWLEDTKREARAQGISPRTIAATLDGVTYDTRVISLDRNQKAFRQSFQQFSAQRITAGRVSRARQLLRTHAATLSRIEARYGVPGEMVVAIWGLETDFGAVTGNMPVVRSLATLTYDCRRSDFFRPHLFGALQLVERGDLPISDMRGAWAGELGQTQFLPGNYLKYAVDFDGDGRRDLVRSTPDVLASTANFLAAHGWQKGRGWSEGEPNFPVIRHWNRSMVYAQTIAAFAERLGGDGPVPRVSERR